MEKLHSAIITFGADDYREILLALIMDTDVAFDIIQYAGERLSGRSVCPSAPKSNPTQTPSLCCYSPAIVGSQMAIAQRSTRAAQAATRTTPPPITTIRLCWMEPHDSAS